MSSRPFVTIYDGITGEAEKTPVRLPAVFLAPIRGDVVHFVYRNQSKNTRQPEGVSTEAGKQHSAISWGTGRAVARIPRISGSGSGRNGQGAFGNMTRKGHMFSPLKNFRKWQRKTPKQMRRFAVASCIAASAVPALVSARGHHIAGVPQIPLVVNSKSISVIKKTKQAVYLLKKINAYSDVLKVIASKTVRAGQGKMRGRKIKERKGPLVVYGNDDLQAVKAFRNIPGVDTCRVENLSVLNLAPGCHMGRFIIWTESAFKKLNTIFGTQKKMAQGKSGFRIAHAQMAVPDMKRVVVAAEKAKLLRAKIVLPKVPKRTNPLKNWAAMVKLNPYAKIASHKLAQVAKAQAAHKAQYAAKVEKILAAKKEALNQSVAKRFVKAQKVDGKVVKVKVENNLLKGTVKRTAKQAAYMKKYDGIVKANAKKYAEKIGF
ncbi:60S ribosomal protein L4, putative [Entamoeba dispar SAW760]|uniref:Large ribosomal subunit protein uL4 n=1 Tax=Entamoeba dispar (strain ATCC PRA-260 / SAW760) TaxID=370354 RepID=B0ETG0_ENTDS|nr:60S ribosomal protein L4, putative [Entamoeba dispar SAW760]XP_001741540.1 60S ribosomal protein L4, putative [Entamoeba dispar SAW760]XP_001742003.1 60S ribosomal protein L4, putative [Entamoeba dispar SAW760]EDR21540.1 60S ribosomal protein L4, putative [Entamoeba dispar SAW760]EDR21994.1 60S ribosomal protein L4, putative [Entamoeba dispar SAW760]EDR22145.1 60S ribosomal protein L4, putative [Entamoeba dispar SAW760]|eukprot:EDR21540.1 60S ribosomal protein L4, putative [Entamoeba dispar SAW760]